MTRHKLLEHGGSRINICDQASLGPDEVAEHLSVLWNLIPKASVSDIVSPLLMCESAAILEDCFPDGKPILDCEDSGSLLWEYETDSLSIQ